MCRAESEGGRRCNGHTPYGIMNRNLQAVKQYHQRRLNTPLTEDQKIRTIKALDEAKQNLQILHDEKQSLGTVVPHVMNLTKNTERVLSQLEADGFKPFIVGGSVRDALMGIESKDVDIEVYGGQPDSIAASLRKIGQVDEVGKSFGVLKIQIQGEDFDVSLPRKDSKIGSKHTDFTVEVDPDLSLEEATARRDYTLNALMYSHRLGFIIDKHGGVKDMHAKQLKHVSDAYDEDPLRVLRGVQMASRFGMVLHPDTVVKAKSLKDTYKDLATERVQIEFQKLYEKGKATHKALQVLQETEWDQNFSGLAEANTPEMRKVVERTQKLLADSSISKEKAPLLISSVIALHLSDKDAQKFLSVTTVGDDLKNRAYQLSRFKLPETQDDAALRTWAYSMPRKLTIDDWADLAEARGDAKVAKAVRQKAANLGLLQGAEKDMLKGDDILAETQGVRPGPWMRNLLQGAREAQYSNIFRTNAGAVAWLKKNKQNYLPSK